MTELIGRRTEIDLLESEFEQVRARRPRAVFVAGAAGIGKSALIQHFVKRHSTEAQVLEAAADESESDLAFGLLENLLAARPIRLAGRLKGVVAGRVPTPEPLAVGVEVLDVLGRMQRRAPVIVFVDDAQWADRPSLAALTFALRRLRADQVLAVVAVRVGTEASLPPGLLRLTDRERGQWIRLGGLQPAELQALTARTGPAELTLPMARRLHKVTQGNPLYALTLLSEVGAEALRGEHPLPPPPSLSVLVLSRLARCSRSTVKLVRAAAVLGQRCPVDIARRLADVDRPLRDVEEASAAGLLGLEDGGGDTLAFTHPLIHAVVYADLGPAQRAELHSRAAMMVDDAAALEHRVLASGPGDIALAQELQERAIAAAAGGAWPAASRHLLAAARLDPQPEVRSRRVLQAASLMLSGLDVGGALALRDMIVALPPSPTRAHVLGQLAFYSGTPSEAERLFSQALTMQANDDPLVTAASAAGLAQCRLLASRGNDAVEAARTAIRLAPAGSPIRGIARAAELVGMGIAGRAAEALEAIPGQRQSVPGAERFEELTGIGILRLWIDDLGGARRDLSAVEAFVASHGPTGASLAALFYLAEAEFRAGAWGDALAHAYHLASLAADTDAIYSAPYADAMVATVSALRGEWDVARKRKATLESSPVGPDMASRGYSSLASGQLALARGDPAGALAAMAPLVEMAEMDGMREPGVMPWRDLYAEALVRLGRQDEAEATLAELEALARKRRLASAMVAAARVRGMLESSRGADARAKDAFKAGQEQARGIGMPFLQARLAMEHGAFLRRTGHRRAAAARLEEAADLLTRLRAEPFLERCERELEACGRRRALRGTSHLTVTPQELAVARLIARGLSNRAAASELVLSVKTVEYHLSNLYGKLGVSSRTQLVARLLKEGQITLEG